MIEQEKVVKGLTACVTAGLEKACPTDCPYFLQCFPDVGPATPFVLLMQDALALLKKQEPVKPILKREWENKLYNDYECPVCGNDICYGQRFCSVCGREVKWE